MELFNLVFTRVTLTEDLKYEINSKLVFFLKLTAAKFKDFFLLFPYFVSEMHELTNVETSAKFDVFFL